MKKTKKKERLLQRKKRKQFDNYIKNIKNRAAINSAVLT